MWEKSLQPLSLADNVALPDLDQFASGPEDRELLLPIELTYEQIDARQVISILLRLAFFRWFLPFKTEGILRAKLAQSGGRLVDVKFQLNKSRGSDGGRHIELSRM